MQEKDIREKLNQEIDKMAPDILDKILTEPIEPVKNEKELFGKSRSLFIEKKNAKKYIWLPVSAVIAACIAMLVMVLQPYLIMKPEDVTNTKVAFYVTIDVNPSISIAVKEDGTVQKIHAENKDAKKIVKAVNEKITEDTDYNKAVKIVVKQLNKNGYLQKKKNGMLVSVISEDKDFGKEKLEKIKTQTKEFEKDKDIKCITVYQNCEKSNKVVKIAKKNGVSEGKAALCLRLAERENESVKKMCQKNIEALIKKAEQGGAVITDDEIVIDSGLPIEETESETFEMESVSETESVGETESTEISTEFIEETTILEDEHVTGRENVTEEKTAEIPQPDITNPAIGQ